MKVVSIIQARMGSTRLPGKVLKSIGGRSVLAHVVRRVSACGEVNQVVVATTQAVADDAIVKECEALGVAVFRGSEADVLERYYLAACEYDADIVIRVTSDCPLFDPNVLAQMLELFMSGRDVPLPPDYLSNTLVRSFPRGLDAEIFTFDALADAYLNAIASHEREHVTPFIYLHPERFSLQNFVSPKDYSEHRWTLDTVEDWSLISEIYDRLYIDENIFTTADVLNLLEKEPQLFALNAGIEQKTLLGKK